MRIAHSSAEIRRQLKSLRQHKSIAFVPDMAIFGEKDWQQLTILRRMVSDLQLPIDIIASKTMREESGLAKSSRNRYLTDAERQQAIALSQALKAMQQLAKTGERDIGTLKAAASNILNTAKIKPEYLDIRNATSLKNKRKLNQQPARAFIAAHIGNTRLIDNMSLDRVSQKPPAKSGTKA